MKFYKYSLIAALALSGAMFSCSDDDDYAPGKPVSGDEVYFPLSQETTIDIPTDATEVSVKVCRLDDAAEVTVPVTATVTDDKGTPVTGVFTVPAQVTFPAGANETNLTIAIDFAKVEPDVDYIANLKLEGDNITPYGASERAYTLLYSPWSEWKPIDGEVADYIMTVYASAQEEVPVLMRKSLIDENRVEYGVCDLFYINPDEEDGPLINIVYSMNLKNTIEIDGVECPIVSASTLNCGENGEGSGNYLMLYDLRTWAVEIYGVAEESVDAWMERNGFIQSHYNPQTGRFTIDYILTGTALAVGSYYSMGYDYLQLPGFKDYFVEFDYTGNYVDTYEGVEYAVLSGVKSEDVNNYIYDIYAGDLGQTQFEAALEDLKNAEEPATVTEASTKLAFALEEEGSYTIVAIGRDAAGKEVCTASYTFDYVTVQGAPKWQSLGYCEYTDGFLCKPNAYGFDARTFDVEIQESTEFPGYYRLIDPYAQLAELYSGTFTYLKGKHYMYVDATNPTQVNIEESWLGIADADGEYGALSLSYYYLASGETVEDVADAGFFGTLKNDMITFPAGTLGLIQGTKIYTANKDPKNPTLGTADSNPYLGTGTFMIDLSVLESAAAPKRKINAPVSNCERLVTKPFKSNFKLKTKTVVTDEAINAYRLANPRSLR